MLGQTLAGRYKLTRILGAGGFGQTYLAIDIQQSHKPQCVVKQLKPASQDANFLVVARRLFETEVKILGELGDHPHIPYLLASFEEDNEFYLVQEYIDGQSLEDEINQAGQLSEPEVIALLEGVLPVLGFIHEHHVVHRDLKPDNLIRRRSDGEIVLIDFGAVKEIRTRIITGEQTALTIGIGTQGYTPSEQLSGKPRYSSDIYALGMTAIHALTGRSPADLPEDFGNLDPCWQEHAQVSPGLAILLGKMTRHYIYHRYQTVAAVRQDLTRLDELIAELVTAETALDRTQRLDTEEKTVILRWRMSRRAKWLTAAIATVVTSTLILGMRQLGAFVPAELAVHDALLRAQTDRGPDPRLLLVNLTAADLRSPMHGSNADDQLAQVIEALQEHQPARIAIDLPHNLLKKDSNKVIRESLKTSNVVTITQLENAITHNPLPRLPGMTWEQLSFSDIVRDSDFRVRRSLMIELLDEAIVHEGDRPHLIEAIDNEAIDNNLDDGSIARPIFSLGTELAIHYLGNYHNIFPEPGDTLQLGDVRFEPIPPSFGGYQKADTSGYQMFMRYRSSQKIATELSFTDVLENNFVPDLIKDKIVLIGSTATSDQNVFFTPYHTGDDSQLRHRIVVHAQVTSQILSAVLEGEPVPWAWPDWVEVVWIIALTGIGGTLMVLTQKGPILILFGVSGLGVTFLVGVVCFQAGGWVPVAAPMSAFFSAAAGARISKSYQRRHWENHLRDTSMTL